MNKIVFLLALVIGATAYTANAQVLNKNTTFKLGGLGRSVLTNDKLSGPILDGDTTSANKGLGGYTLFDLNADLTINQIFNANVIMRIKNPYGSFYGQDTYFEFRQLQFNGRIGRNLKYEFGDIYVGLTPYTVYNANEPTDNKFEAASFKVRRDILEYENFYVGNKWRLQGVQLNYGLDSVVSFKRINLKVFGVRTNVTNDNTIPDRVFLGGRLDLIKNDKLKFGLNAVSFTDLPVSTTEVELHNNVFTGDVAYTWQNDALLLGFALEGGISDTKYQDNSNSTSSAFSDYFYNPELKAGIKSVKINMTAGYRNVGPQFNSPSAQTQRVNAAFNPIIFPTLKNMVSTENPTGDRGQVLYDRSTEEGVYNRSLSQSLQNFAPQYGNITPYGAATPNRTGISAGVATDTSLHNIMVEANVDLLSEINSEGSPGNLRKFTGIRGGLLLNIAGLAKINRLIDFSVGVKNENTTRDGSAAIDFKSMIIDGGFAIETFRKVDLIAGVKLLTAKGNEYLTQRNANTSIVEDYIVYQYDGSENTYCGGLRFRFAEYAQASLVYNTTSVKRTINASVQDYTYNQLFMSFILKF